MAYNPRLTAPDRFRSAVAELTRRGVTLPETVAAAATDLERVEGLCPVEITDLDVRRAYADPDQTPADLDALVQRAATSPRLRQAWGEARSDAALRGLSALHDEAAALVEALRDQAEAAIDEVEWYAQAGEPTVADLVRAGRTKDATRAAAVTTAFAEWGALRTLRQQVTGRDFPWAAVGTWANTEEVEAAWAGSTRGLSGLDYFAAVIREGGVVYWPTMAEAADAAARLNQARKKATSDDARAARIAKQAAF